MATIFTFPKASRVGDRVEILSISNEKMPINIIANPEAEKPLELIYPDNVYSSELGGTTAVIQITDVNVLFIEEDSGERLLGKNNINQQTTDNFELQPNESVILKNEIDPLYESDELATKLNYGLIKIGTNISCVDGVISRKKVQTATKNRAGIIQFGSGINIENGIISPDGATPATHENFGTVKLGNGFEINKNGEMELQDMADASIIYKLSQAGVVKQRPYQSRRKNANL